MNFEKQTAPSLDKHTEKNQNLEQSNQKATQYVGGFGYSKIEGSAQGFGKFKEVQVAINESTFDNTNQQILLNQTTPKIPDYPIKPANSKRE